MLQKIHENTAGFSSLITKAPFYEGKCSNWQYGEGIFIQKISDQVEFLYMFESDGAYKSYEIITDVFPA